MASAFRSGRGRQLKYSPDVLSRLAKVLDRRPDVEYAASPAMATLISAVKAGA